MQVVRQGSCQNWCYANQKLIYQDWFRKQSLLLMLANHTMLPNQNWFMIDSECNTTLSVDALPRTGMQQATTEGKRAHDFQTDPKWIVRSQDHRPLCAQERELPQSPPHGLLPLTALMPQATDAAEG